MPDGTENGLRYVEEKTRSRRASGVRARMQPMDTPGFCSAVTAPPRGVAFSISHVLLACRQAIDKSGAAGWASPARTRTSPPPHCWVPWPRFKD